MPSEMNTERTEIPGSNPATRASRNRIKARWYHKLILLGLGVLLACAIVELALRFTKIVRNVGPSFTTYDSEYGKRLKRSFSCVRKCPEFTMKFTSNSQRFRGPEPDGPTKHGIVFLGDSFTMGYGVNDGEEYPSLVGEELFARTKQRLPIVNMGMGNNGNGRWLKLLEREVEQHEPKLVVFQVCGNDYNDNINENLYRYTESGDLIENAVPGISRLRRIHSFTESVPLLSSSYLFCYLKQVAMNSSQGGGGGDPAPSKPLPDEARLWSPAEELTFALIEEALTVTTSRGWPTLVLSVVSSPRQNDELAARCKKHGVDLVLIPYGSERPDLYYKVDHHWNKAGHQYVAQAVTDVIVEKLAPIPASKS